MLLLNKTALVLIIANLYPIFGVLFLGWNISDVLLLYWAESGVIGVYNILKMLSVKKISNGNKQYNTNTIWAYKIGMCLFFLVHYGAFMAGHLFFLSVILNLQNLPKDPTNIINFENLYVPLGILFASHGISYAFNFVLKKEYKTIAVDELMVKPYGRIMLMHVTIIFGAFLVFTFGSNLYLILLLILLKTIVDLFAHYKEHQQK